MGILLNRNEVFSIDAATKMRAEISFYKLLKFQPALQHY